MATQQLKNAYMLTKVLTANKHEVVVYLYEGAIGFIHRACEAVEAGNREACGQAVDRAMNIVIELSGNLNYNASSSLALRLDGIYNYLIESLSLANARQDVDALRSCEGILVILHDAWTQAVSLEAHNSSKNEQTQHLRISA